MNSDECAQCIIAGVEMIDSLWFIDSMRAFTLHILYLLYVCMPIYFRLITVAAAACAAASTIQCAAAGGTFFGLMASL